MQKNQYDAVVIGAGSGGLTAAVGLSKVGKKVLLVEREHMGGECTNTGCIPSKALLHHAKSYYQAKKVAGVTEHNETYREEAFAYVRATINNILGEETAEHFKAQGIDVVMGEAVFTSKNTIVVADQTYTFKKAVIATGSSPRPLVVEGLQPEHVVTNQNIFNLESIPERLLIIGAGPIGLELGQALAMLGSHVTIADNGPRLARLEDEAISPIIASAFKELGITVLHNAEVTKVEGTVAFISQKDTSETAAVPFDTVLVAIGRVPNIPKGLEAAGVAATQHGVTVNSNWQSSNKNIYALGDVAARLKFTHVADDTARQVVTHLVSRGLISVKEKQVPKVTYTEPEIAQVGLSWNEAKDTHKEENIHRIEVSFGVNDRARTDDAAAGLLVVIAKRLTGEILGAHIIGPRAGELIGIVTLAMENNLSLYRLRSAIFAYPTYSLILKKAGDYFLAKQISTLKVDLFNLAKSAAPKLLVAILWITLLMAVYSYQKTFGLTASELSLKLFTAITASVWAPLLYILVYTIRPITFFPGTALTVLSGVFFGLWGILYTIIGANLSATLAYFIGRFFSKEKSTSATSRLGRLAEAGQKHPFLSVLTMRLTFMPFDVVNYGAGLLKFPFVPYLSATILGTILGIATFVAIGASLSVEEFIENGITADAIDGTFIILSVVIFLVSLGVSKFIQKKSAA
jgi:pyruvate/2-oxoglutarate dehydrogenase complex dihydrolipoamide dehydrogenase (E3) component/uncharacterized membrane protein YdjX (TVP38/TMEM64 family)